MSSPPPSGAKVPDKPTLTDYLRANTRWLIDPIVEFMARFRLSPDVLTVAGMLAHLVIAWLVSDGRFRAAALTIIFVGPLDALDGALARRLGRAQGGFGAFLDSTLDRLAEIILFGGFIIYYSAQGELWLVLASYVALTGSVMVSYTRARAEALGIPCKVGILSRVERYGVLVLSMLLGQPGIGILLLAVGTYLTAAQRMFHVWRQANK